MSATRSALTVAFALLAVSLSLPAAAGAYATIAPPPSASTASGLPDGRVYEEASPANKHGYQAGAVGPSEEEPVTVFPSIAAPDGEAVSFGAYGPAAETDTSGLNVTFVAERTEHGWVSRASMARALGLNKKLSLVSESPNWLDYTPNLSKLAYAVLGRNVAAAPEFGAGNFYLFGSNPQEEPTWLLREGVPSVLAEQNDWELLGMSPQASIIYIAYKGRLLPQDAKRAGWGLYAYREGRLSEVGVLPDGSVPAGGAMAAATASTTEGVTATEGENNPASLDNQVSEDGRRLFFVAGGELYVHEMQDDGERSVLASASQLPGHVGETAPDGVALFANRTKNADGLPSAPTYAYASADGSHVVFQSEDQLTAQAPAGSALKTYDFDVETEALEYLPGVALGGVVTAASDGSSFVFVNDAGTPEELDVWSAGPGGGSIRQIAQLPGGGSVGPGRLAGENSVLVFQTGSPIAGFNNAGTEQVYRYDAKSDELACLSCLPAGVHPSGSAYLSAIDQYEDKFNLGLPGQRIINDVRGVSSDGNRVFFESPDPLVSRDVNGQPDVYEWENGSIFLISSGTSTEYSLLLDNSESGGDVFFATSDELVRGDNDAGFDVYDARIPRPGDNPPPSAVPCTGDVCQGPPTVPQLLGAPPSATFNGAGNIEEPPTNALENNAKTNSKAKTLTAAQRLKRALRACKRVKARKRRLECERAARKRYAAKPHAKRAKRGNAKSSSQVKGSK